MADDVRQRSSTEPSARAGRERDANRPVERDTSDGGPDRSSLLADVSRRLADSLDYETTLATVASMSLPYLDAWCIVDVLGDDGSIRRLAVLHQDPAKQEAARALRERYPPSAEDFIGAARVFRTGLPEIEHDIPDEKLVAQARDAEHLAILRALGVRSYVIVPMVARGMLLGAITFVTAEGDRRFRSVDVALAEDLASRAAMAIDNSRLYLAAKTSRVATEAAIGAAEEAGRRKSEFLATMSHEFRTPLNAILGYAQILDMGVLGPTTSTQHAHLERLQASAHHLLQLVDDVLDVAKVDADRLDVRHDSLMTGASIATSVALVHPQATAKGIRLLDLGADAPGDSYIGDERRVRQILVNLLSNAVKFTPPGGEVTVAGGATEEPDPGTQLASASAEHGDTGAQGSRPRWAFIRVVDTGPGITPEFMSRLFEPFAQADGALTREKGGTGLGLAISRRLARRMGGDITARSRIGAGATFTLWLPTRGPEASSSPVASVQGRASTATAIARRSSSLLLASLPGDGANLDDDAYAVLHAIGTRLSVDAETISERYVMALRADGRFPGARELGSVQLRDHATPFIGLLASQLTILGETRGQDPELLADGGHAQRLMAELHGAQRHRLGWSEADIERETKILIAEVERAIQASVDTSATVDATGPELMNADRSAESLSAVRVASQYALDVAVRVLDQGSQTTIRTFRFAKDAETP